MHFSVHTESGKDTNEDAYSKKGNMGDGLAYICTSMCLSMLI